MLSEPQVTESVERYFSRPQFTRFYIQREVQVQIGSYAGRADIVLYTDTSSPQMIAIVECKGKEYKESISYTLTLLHQIRN